MVSSLKGFIFPFGLKKKAKQKLLEHQKEHPFLSRWSIDREYSGGYICFDKYYRKKCFFTRRLGTPILVYDWIGYLEPYEMHKYANTAFNTSIIKHAYLIEIFPNRWGYSPIIRVLYDGQAPMEIFFSADGKIITPYFSTDSEKIHSIEDFRQKAHELHPDLQLSRGFTVFKTLDKNKPYRIVHEGGYYFVVRNGSIESHIPYGLYSTIDKINELV